MRSPPALVVAVLLCHVSRADIYQWEWIDPDDPLLGRRESSTPCPDDTGHDAVPGAFLGSLDLTRAWLYRATLQSAFFGTRH